MPQPGNSIPNAQEYRHSTVILLAVLAVIAVAATLKVASSVFIPLVISIFLCYLINFISSALTRLRLPQLLTIPVILAAFFGILLLLEMVVVNTITDIMRQAPVYQLRLENLVEGLISKLGTRSTILTEFDWSGRLTQALTSLSVTLFGSVVNFVSNAVLVILYTAFILAGRKAMTHRVARAFSKTRAREIQEMLQKINSAVQRYVVTKILVCLVEGVLVTLVLLAFGVDFALFWGLLTFLLNFIPTLGSIISTLLPVTLALLQFESPWTSVAVFLCLMGLQQGLGNVVEPIVQGRRMNLSPIVILFALVSFGWLWGFWGMVLSVPLTAMAKIAMEQTSMLKSFTVMLEKE